MALKISKHKTKQQNFCELLHMYNQEILIRIRRQHQPYTDPAMTRSKLQKVKEAGSRITVKNMRVRKLLHLAPRIRFFSGTFWLWGWIRQGKDKRFLHSQPYLYISILALKKSYYRDTNICRKRKHTKKNTALIAAMASMTSLVNVFPFPEVPINTVGLIA